GALFQTRLDQVVDLLHAGKIACRLSFPQPQNEAAGVCDGLGSAMIAEMPQPQGTTPASPAYQRWLPWLLLLAIFLAYHNSLTGPFILDDERCIINNPHIRQLWPLTKPLAHTSRPIVQLSLALNYALGGLDVRGYHVVNL